MTNLGDLEVFATVAASGSMSLAAKELGYSPAVISKRIKRLEEKLGARLFQRTTRQISLTEAGQGFYERWKGWRMRKISCPAVRIPSTAR